MKKIFDSTVNTRYLPTGDKRYIRSDVPLAITEEEMNWLLENGYTTVIDLRDEAEMESRPCPLLFKNQFSYYCMPVTGGGDPPRAGEELIERYKGMVDEQMESILKIIMSAPDKVLYFCSAGKDRTGVVSALLLKQLGVENEVILHDYLESGENLLPMLTDYVKAHPEVNLELLIPKEENIAFILNSRPLNARIHETRCGMIHYWISMIDKERPTLVFLPGLTADHRLFEKQIAYFKERKNVFVWDAPGHASSWPFSDDFDLKDKAIWLDEILTKEEIAVPVIVGQSMGGYVGQMYAQLFPEKIRGFISIDSCPLQRSYMSSIEIWLLKHTEPMYRAYPWKTLVKAGAKGCAETEYGRELMKKIIMVYDSDHERYIHLVSHGYQMVAEATEADLPYEIPCPSILICGEKDHAGSAKSYNRRWARKTGLPIEWLPDAGHNSNTDAPEKVNELIENFLENLR